MKKLTILKSVKKRITGVSKRVKKFLAYKVVLPLAYKWYKRKPVDEKLVVFADLRDRDMPDNFIGLYKMCEEQGYHCEVLSGKSYGKDVPKRQARIAKIKFQFRFMCLYAQCRAVFLVEYFPLADIVKPREGTDVVQLWHGCGAMKVMGYASRSGKWGASDAEKKRYPMHRYYSFASVSSEDVVPCYEEAFETAPGVVRALGMPRTDIYFNQEYISSAKKRIREIFPEIGNRKVILFAPTFRGKSIAKSSYTINFDIRKLKAALEKDYVFVTKFHPLMASGGLTASMLIQGKGFLFDATRVLTPEEANCAADVLVGDYSSIMFEYMLLGRPMISYIPDLDTYISDRGLFFPYEETMPGPYAFDGDELIEQLQTVSEWFDPEKTKQYCKKFMSGCDGHSTERIFNETFNK